MKKLVAILFIASVLVTSQARAQLFEQNPQWYMCKGTVQKGDHGKLKKIKRRICAGNSFGAIGNFSFAVEEEGYISVDLPDCKPTHEACIP